MGLRRGTPLCAWFEALHRAWGPQGWWPGRTRFEIVVGAFLTQGVSWVNVEKAIGALRASGLLHPRRMLEAGERTLARHVHPAGYFNQKAAKLVTFTSFLATGYGGRLDRLFREPTGVLRRRLLALRGVGPETADSILLYAAGRPVFVIDAYTRRILTRHGAASGREPYDDLRRGFESALAPDPRLFNEFHALIVRAGKEHCRSREPACRGCPLEPFLPAAGPRRFAGRRRRHPARRTGTRRNPARGTGPVD